MARFAPHARKIAIREVSTGTVIERWPVDAREIVANSQGKWEYAPLDTVPTPVAGEPAVTTGTPETASTPSNAPRSIAEILDDSSYKELQAMAKAAGVNSLGQKKPELILLLVPHVESGTISIETVQGLPIVPNPPLVTVET